MRAHSILTAAFLSAASLVTTSSAQVVFVDGDATGPTHDGSSWCGAYLTLQDALVAAVAGETIRIANGTYVPDLGGGHSAGDRTASFTLVSGVTVEGGYAGCGAPIPDQRDLVLNETILSGDIGTIGVNADNSYHVVRASGSSPNDKLDGVTITLGNADAGSAPNNRAGGMLIENANPELVDCTFRQNNATASAGAVFVNPGAPVFRQCTFDSNTGGWAGAIELFPGCDATFENCDFVANSCPFHGGSMVIGTSTATMTGCSFTWNTAGGVGGAIVLGGASTMILDTCDFQNNATTNNQGGAIGIWSGGSVVQATSCNFADNTSGAYAGALATDGATVTLDDCTFTGNEALNGAGGAADLFDSNVTMTNCAFANNQSSGGGGAVILDNNTGAGVDGCSFDQNVSVSGSGGAMRIAGASSQPSVRNSTFTGNSASQGGAIVVIWGAAPTIEDCTFTQNSGNSGGAIEIQQPNTVPTIRRCGFLGNSAGLGGAMVIGFGAAPNVEDCTFTQNTGGDGGAINIQQANAVATFRRCDFTDNSATFGGAVIIIFDGSSSLEDCRFQSNQSSSTGSAVNVSVNSLATATNCLFADNSAETFGAFVTWDTTTASTITNCTFTRNTGVIGTGGVWSGNAGSTTIVNSVLWGNTWPGASLTEQQIDQDGTSSTTVNHTLVQGAWTGAGGTTIVNRDPLFADPDGLDDIVGNLDDDFRLDDCSPAINVGDNPSIPVGVTTDLDGNPRIVETTVDLGAYEHQAPCVLPDADGDGVCDACDVCPGGDDRVDNNGNGVPDDCDVVPLSLAPPPHDILKNRYISVDPRGAGDQNVGLDFDIRVTLSNTLMNGVTAVGSSWWANAPDANCISIVGPTRPTAPPNWDACPTLHLTGCPIIPTSTYQIVTFDGSLITDPPFAADTQAKPGVKWWGDCVGNFNGTVWTPPQGVTNIDDAVAAIKTWQGPGSPTATHLSVTDVHPNLSGTQINKVVNFDDVFQFILAFQGGEYPGPGVELCTDP